MIQSEIEKYVWSHIRWQVDGVIHKQVHANVFWQVDTSVQKGFRVGIDQEARLKVVSQLRLDMEGLL